MKAAYSGGGCFGFVAEAARGLFSRFEPLTSFKMPGIKDEREDSDGEEMDHESDQSDKSTSSCDSSDASDSDDSSEMDEEECERRRDECIDSLADMERQFNVLREQLYQERITQVDAKLGEVKLGRAHEYLQPLEQLEENLRIRNEVNGILRSYRMTNVRNKFQAEEAAALQNYQSEKILLWDSIKDDLEEKIRMLEEDRNNIDFSAEMWVNEQRRTGWRNGYKSGRGANNNSSRNSLDLPGRRKPLTVSGPYVVYMLSDEDILEDWTAIKKALSVCKRKSELSI